MIESEIPGILVAMPSLENTYFEKSIILLCNYNAEGAFGLIMNRRTLKGQRKISIPVRKMQGKKKEKIEKTSEPSCEDPGCGCGN